MNAQRPSVLMLAAKWWPLSARLASALLSHGCRVSALCPAGHPLACVSGLESIHHYAGIRSLRSLRRSISKTPPDVVVPCDDGVVAQLHALHARESSLRALIERSLGPPESYPIVSSRYRCLSSARELGIAVPRTRRVVSAEDLASWHKQSPSGGVLKLDGESGGNGVRICRSFDESLMAWQELRVRRSFAAAWKRLLINKDPLAVWMSQNRADREVTIQDFIVGRPANSMLLCLRGEVLTLMSVVVVASEGPTGAAVIVRPTDNERMLQAARLLARRLQLTGFFGLDFMIEDGTGIPYLIELNPRCTQLGHLEMPAQGSLAGVFSATWRGEPRPDPERPIRANTIALFPQALAAGAACSQYIETSYHDLPSDQPALIRELLLEPWPQRQWMALLYHAFRPVRRPEPVQFERPASPGAAQRPLGVTAASPAFDFPS